MSYDQKKGLLGRLLSSIDFLVNPDLTTKDRRTSPRVDCQFRLHYVNENGKPGEAELLDVSSKGLRLRTYRQLPLGMTLALNSPESEDLGRFPPLMAKVIWSIPEDGGTHRAGLALPSGADEENTWLDLVLEAIGYADDGSQRRQHIRAVAEISGQLVLDDDPDEEMHKVWVQNLGMGGALIQHHLAFPKNAQFSLTLGPHEDLPEISVAGTILRVAQNKVKGVTYHPSRFRPLDDFDEKVLREYILNLIGRE